MKIIHIKLDDDLHSKLKISAFRAGMTIQTYVAEDLQASVDLDEEDPEEAKRFHQSNKTVKTKPSIPDALIEDPNIKIASEAFRGKLCPHNMVWGTCGYASCKKKG